MISSINNKLALRSVFFFASALVSTVVCAPALADGTHSSGGISSADQHINDDAYWAALAQDYPPFRKYDSSLNAVAAAPTDKDELGEWSSVIQWPHIPVSAANLPDGRVLTWASNQRNAFPGGQPEFTYTAVFDPATQTFDEKDHPGHDMFCAHQVVLNDGRILVAGGRNHVRYTSIFDPVSDSWTKTTDDMNNGRWYPTAIAVPDNKVFIGIGSSGGRYPELWTSGSGWQTLGNIDFQVPILNYSGFYEQNWWPFFGVAPDGDVIHYGPTPEMHRIELDGNGSITPVGPHNAGWYPKHGANAMYDVGKILVAGGAISGSNQASTNKSVVVDINGATPTVTPVAPMIYPRKFNNAVILPNGEVLIVGGNTSGIKFNDSGTVLAAEIWNPQSQTWREVADMAVPRNYHSIALLLTDGRVLSGGGGLCGNCSANHSDAEIYSPPYLFNPDGSLATRPSLTSVPSSIAINATFGLQATPGITRMTMIKMSSTTHAVNTDLRFVELNFSEPFSGNYQVTTHSNENVLMPGIYMLFAIDAQGVPSEASVVQVLAGPAAPDTVAPSDPSNLVATPVSSTQIDLTFDGSIDTGGSGLAGYRVYRNGDPTPVATVNGTSYSDSGLQPNSSYSYQVTAIDNAAPANESGFSNIANATTSATSGWWDTNWSEQRKLTFDNSGIPEPLSNFPVLVRLTPQDINYALIQSNGEDIRFIDSTGNTELAYEIADWTWGGDSFVWVKVPQIDANSAVDHIWLYYNNPSAPDAQDPANVWQGYAGVWHLEDSENDSSANANHGTNFGTVATPGQVGQARSFDGNSYIDLGNDSSLGITGAVTLEAWVKIDPSASGSPRIISKKVNWNNDFGYNLEFKPAQGVFSTLGSGSDVGRATNTILGTTWRHLVATNDNGVAALYVDGTEVTTDSTVSQLAADLTPLNIGRRAGGASYFTGQIDEVMIYPAARSASWVMAASRSSSGSFVTITTDTGGNVAPTVSINSPSDGSTFTTPVNITLGADANDSDGNVERVDFYAGASLIGSDDTDPYSFVWNNPVAGSYSLIAVAVDDEGLSASSQPVNITVQDPPANQPPEVSISANVTAGPAPLAVSFDATGSFDPDGSIVSYSWDFGDGSNGSGIVTNHQFVTPGDYTVTLTLTDDDGDSSSDSIIISAADQWWNANWSGQRKVVFDNIGILENLIEIPVLVELTPADIDYNSIQGDGSDIRIIDADGSTELSFEIADWNWGGTSYLWVKVPQIDANSTNDHVWIYYGNPTATSSEDSSAVWSSYAGVWHFDSDDLDSTTNQNHGSNFGATSVTGYISGARAFDGSSYIDVGSDASLALTTQATIEAWVVVDPAASGSPRIVSKKINWDDDFGYNLEYKPSSSTLSTLGGGRDAGRAEGVVLGNSWHHLVAVNNNGSASLFVDGVEVTTDASVSPLAADSTPMNIGRRAGAASYFTGVIDEVRISPQARSAAWIEAQYRSMSGTYAAVTTGGGGNIAPSATITSPAQGDSFVTPVDLLLNADATDSDGTIDQVNFYSGSTLVGTDNLSPYSIIWGSVPAGSHVLTAVAIDNNGAAGSSPPITIDVQDPEPLVVDPLDSPPVLVGESVSYTAVASGSSNLQYTWSFGDGSPDSPLSASPTINHTFVTPGRYVITATVSGDDGQSETVQLWQAVYEPATANKPAASMSIIYEERIGSNDRLWNVNPDNDSVTVTDAITGNKLSEISVGNSPRSLALAPDSRVWVTNNSDSTISIIDGNSLTIDQTINLDIGAQPYGIVFNPAGSDAYVVLEGRGQLAAIDSISGAVVGNVETGPNPRHLSIASDGTRIFVSRFITPPLPGESSGVPITEVGGVKLGGEVVVVETGSLTVDSTIILQHSDKADSEHASRGIPNYLGVLAINPSGNTAWVPSNQANIKRGVLRDGQPLTHDSTVRAISSKIDLTTLTEDYPARLDHDDGAVPSAAIYGRYGSYMFVALEGSQEIAVVEPYGLQELVRFDAGSAPQGLAVSPDGTTVYVHNFLDRSITVHDVTNVVIEGGLAVTLADTFSTVASEALDAKILNGKRLFYNAKDPRLSLQSYMSCASCHNDGRQDGRVWDLTGFGEGLRNTVRLKGRAAVGHGRPHWTANFDEIQDFEGQIRALSGGTGLMDDADFFAGSTSEPLGDPKAGISPDLDALAAYVNSLDEYSISPYRNSDGSLTTNGASGQTIFDNSGCAVCHSGDAFTDSSLGLMHDIGTKTAASGSRLNGPIFGFDTPSLRDAWDTAPYLHDGSAGTLADAIGSHNGIALSAPDLTLLVEYIQQIDSFESTSSVPGGTNQAPTVSITSPTDGSTTETPLDVTITVDANDSDGTVSRVDFYADGDLIGSDSSAPFSTIWSSPDAGNYTLSAAAVDNLGTAAISDEVSISVEDPIPPVASFTVSAPAGVIPFSVDFDASGSFDTDGTITNYDWNFGDGNIDSGQTTSHVYLTPGDYLVTLTVTDNDGATGSTSTTVTAADTWWDSAWSNQTKLTFDNSGIPENLTNFPVLVQLTPAEIDYTNIDSNGNDIRFIDEDGVTELQYEIADWNWGGVSSIWVNVPQIDANSNTDHIWMYFGNSSAAAAQDPAATWPGYAGVWHLDDSEADSSSNGNNGTNFGSSQAVGAIGSARSFDGSSYIDVGNDSSLEITGQITLEAWVQVDPAASGSPRIISKKLNWRDEAGYNLEYKPSNSILTTLGSGSDPGRATGITLGNTWQYIVATHDSGAATLYVNGVNVTTDSVVSPLLVDGTSVNIGRRSGAGSYFNGLIDEVRISPTARSAAWVIAQYRSTSLSYVQFSN